MNDDAQNRDLLDQFKHFLEQEQNDLSESPVYPDLTTLLTEMAGLKAEVKAEARQFKHALDSLADALAASSQDKSRLHDDLSAWAERAEQQKENALRGLLLDIVELYERFGAGLSLLQAYRPAAALFNRSRTKDVRFIRSFQEGQKITLRRFDQLLQRYHVQPIECLGKTFDPTAMKAVATGSDNHYGNGIVLEELRQGFYYRGQVLRLAEVKVNKVTAL
jgi:molecular chaperone GrpE